MLHPPASLPLLYTCPGPPGSPPRHRPPSIEAAAYEAPHTHILPPPSPPTPQGNMPNIESVAPYVRKPKPAIGAPFEVVEGEKPPKAGSAFEKPPARLVG